MKVCTCCYCGAVGVIGILSDGLSDDSDSDSDSDMSDYDSDGSSDGGEGTSDFKDRDENARDFQARQARQGEAAVNAVVYVVRVTVLVYKHLSTGI